MSEIKVSTDVAFALAALGLVEKAKPESTEIQTLIFDKKKFPDAGSVRKWIASHDRFKVMKERVEKVGIDETDESFRVRQKDPSAFQEGSFRTIELTDGVKAVIGRPKEKLAKIAKASEQRLVLGIVLEPEVVDDQGDIISAEEIEKAAHAYMRTEMVTKFRHVAKSSGDIVESFIAPADFQVDGQQGLQTVKKGSWCVVMHVPGDKEWELIKEKKIQAFSIGARAVRSDT